jgi:hypothetical protein
VERVWVVVPLRACGRPLDGWGTGLMAYTRSGHRAARRPDGVGRPRRDDRQLESWWKQAIFGGSSQASSKVLFSRCQRRLKLPELGGLQCGACARKLWRSAVGGDSAGRVDEGGARGLAAQVEIVDGGKVALAAGELESHATSGAGTGSAHGSSAGPPRPDGSMRRLLCASAVRQALVAIRRAMSAPMTGFEFGIAPPPPQIRLLDHVLGIVCRTEHAVAVREHGGTARCRG